MQQNPEYTTELENYYKITVQKLVAELAGCSTGLVSMVWKGQRNNLQVKKATQFVVIKVGEIKKEWTQKADNDTPTFNDR
ncbi:MAG: hypothetical protein H0V01_05530 [Bacteroidetes bacterium]|nr:hypothetical protein [Bacteroidota bacterium]HET6243573.1 hypothetical protein [Bacteroidia bacterium]